MAHIGNILVINDTPGIDTRRLARWLAKQEYGYDLVVSLDEANALLRQDRFDAVVYSHEFEFPSNFLRHALRRNSPTM